MNFLQKIQVNRHKSMKNRIRIEKIKRRLLAGAASGIYNCHVKGVDSLVLEERKSQYVGMERLFIASPGSPIVFSNAGDRGDFTCMPHNHRANLSITVLRGQLTNVMYQPLSSNFFRKLNAAAFLHQYEFTSQILTGRTKLEYKKILQVEDLGNTTYRVGDTFHLQASDVHTVIASPDCIWHVDEGYLYQTLPVYCYSHFPDKKIDTAELYQDMTPDQVVRESHWVYEYLREAAEK